MKAILIISMLCTVGLSAQKGHHSNKRAHSAATVRDTAHVASQKSSEKTKKIQPGATDPNQRGSGFHNSDRTLNSPQSPEVSGTPAGKENGASSSLAPASRPRSETAP